MSAESKKMRDCRFDIMKAISIILVFVGHIMQYGFERYTDSWFFNIIWALQIPLFMFVSGYFTASEKKTTMKDGIAKIGKRAAAYLMPFFSYFYIIKVLILGKFGRNPIEATAKLLYHLESGLWFLWVVFVLSAIFILADVFYHKAKRPVGKLFALALAVFVLLLPWVVFCWKISTTFLGSKYVLYYTVFFGAGFLVRKYKPVVAKLLQNRWIADMGFTVCLAVFAGIIFNTQLCQSSDGLVNTILRVLAGMAGIVVVGSLCRQIRGDSESRVKKAMLLIGENTLEIYAAHGLLVAILPKLDIEIFTCAGYITMAIYTIVIGVLTYGLIAILKANKLTNFLCFGKSLR